MKNGKHPKFDLLIYFSEVIAVNDDGSGRAGNRGVMRYICHQNPERCFHINGKPMKLCARCTGFYPGIITGILLAIPVQIYVNPEPVQLFILAMVMIAPMAVDGITQYTGIRKTNNIIRFITGILGGAGAGLMLGSILADIIL